jgi:hypothetical protein
MGWTDGVPFLALDVHAALVLSGGPIRFRRAAGYVDRPHLDTSRQHGGVHARLRRVAGSATPTSSAGHAGATANLKLTFHPDHRLMGVCVHPMAGPRLGYC